MSTQSQTLVEKVSEYMDSLPAPHAHSCVACGAIFTNCHCKRPGDRTICDDCDFEVRQ